MLGCSLGWMSVCGAAGCAGCSAGCSAGCAAGTAVPDAD